MNDETFLKTAEIYISDDEFIAAAEMNEDPELSLYDACCECGNVSYLVVMALQGKLKEAVARNGHVAPGDRYVDPWRESACLDHSNKQQLAAFAIYRTVQRRPGYPQILKRGACVN